MLGTASEKPLVPDFTSPETLGISLRLVFLLITQIYFIYFAKVNRSLPKEVVLNRLNFVLV